MINTNPDGSPAVTIDEKTHLTTPQPYMWSVGVDLGSVSDSTSICVLQVDRGYEVTTLWDHHGQALGEKSRKPVISYVVRHLHRPRLGTSYPAIIDEMKSILKQLPWLGREPILSIDATGLGTPVLQAARQQGLTPIGITIQAGNTATLTGSNWSVPKALLVGTLRMSMHQKRLQVAQGFRDRERLETELGAFTAKLSDSGRATFAAAGTEHDDTVISLAMACLVAKTRMEATRTRFVNVGSYLER